ncbi:hypothetical protein V500_00753 [Pseudogymnoascus sp. VKM F-4518 (FW-2643)]|nr:hypothetical protein V500_00753 [Pseudogymnoascus sp. VKM F-4518 (FW-2643)]
MSPGAQLQKPQNPAPEPGSFRERVITNQSSYVRPEAWGLRHLHLLDCDILTTDAANEGSRDTISASVENDVRIAYALDTLLGAPGTSSKDAAARALFRLLIPKDKSLFKASSSPPQFFFDCRPVVRTPCPVLFRASTTNRPVFAFLDKTWLSEQRYKLWSHKPVKAAHQRVQQMNKLSFDPYYAGLLISMAQDSRSSTPEGDIEVHLFSPSTNYESFIQYSASVSPEYLQKFDKTYKFSSHHLTITQKKMPVSEPSVITEALRQIGQRCKVSPENPVLRKRKAMSDITNRLDVPSSTKDAYEAKRFCRRENPYD